MKKSILSLGKTLNKNEQQNVFGGSLPAEFTRECDTNTHPGCNCFYSYGWNEDTGEYGKIKECY